MALAISSKWPRRRHRNSQRHCLNLPHFDEEAKMKLSDCHISRCCLVGAISTALISFGIPAYGIPISSNSSFGALNVASGAVVFNTDFTDLTNGGTYSINGVMQSG